jgi:hypothetical protein
MFPKPDDAQERLQRLLALKRHETPPPGFFDRLPNRILLNIRAGIEMAERPWWERAWESLRAEPMVAGSYAALGIGALMFGVSVFQVALEPEGAAYSAPGAANLGGLVFSQPANVEFSPAGHLPSGVIYRVDATFVPVEESLGAFTRSVARND